MSSFSYLWDEHSDGRMWVGEFLSEDLTTWRSPSDRFIIKVSIEENEDVTGS